VHSFQDPIPNIRAEPDPSNILECHFVLEGQKGTPYEGGTYHGKLMFPVDYPFKPPGILFLTPSGRFQPGEKICLSFSDYHPEAWNPIWHVAAILDATMSFMNEESSTTGSLNTSIPERRRLASQSLAASCKNAAFRRMFPDLVEKQQMAEEQAALDSERKEACVCETRDLGAAVGGVDKREWLRRQLEAIMQLLPTLLVAVLAVGIIFVQYSSAVK
jgi:ubiquitin-conjugating enzyme E2 J2